MAKHSTISVSASLAAPLTLFIAASLARADIFQWEYINPADLEADEVSGREVAVGKICTRHRVCARAIGVHGGAAYKSPVLSVSSNPAAARWSSWLRVSSLM